MFNPHQSTIVSSLGLHLLPHRYLYGLDFRWRRLQRRARIPRPRPRGMHVLHRVSMAFDYMADEVAESETLDMAATVTAG
jgi:hypothetical protein